MANFSFDLDDVQPPGLSLSLLSYASEEASVLDDSVPNLQTDVSNSSTEKTLIADRLSAKNDQVGDLLEVAEKSSASGISDSKRQELEAAVAKAKDARLDYLQSMEVTRALKSVANSEILPRAIREKVKNILIIQDLKEYSAPKNGSVGVLGLTNQDLSSQCPQLTAEEKKVIKIAVEAEIIETVKRLKKQADSKQEILNTLQRRVPDFVSHSEPESDHTKRIAGLIVDLNKELDNFYRQVLEIDTLLESIVQMRTNNLTNDCLKLIDGFEAKARFLQQKTGFVRSQIQLAIYTEDKTIVPALQALQKNYDLLYCELKGELAKANMLLTAYEKVKSPEYNCILEEYVSLKKQLKSARYILEKAKISS